MTTPDLPRLLQELRGDRSLREMATLLTTNGHRCSRGAVFNWESGEREGTPSMAALRAYVVALDLSGERLASLYAAAGVPVEALQSLASPEAA